MGTPWEVQGTCGWGVPAGKDLCQQAGEHAHHRRTLEPPLISEQTDSKASLYETRLFKFINIKNYAMML